MNPSQTPASNDPRAPMPGEAPQRRQLTPEEIEVLQECARESFWYRCVPLGVAGAIATKTLIQRGILKPNPYYGSFPKISAAVLIAYFAGKFSYQSACNEKFLKLENSPIADIIRRKNAMKTGGYIADSSADWDYPAPKQYDTSPVKDQKLSEFYDTSSVIDLDSTQEVRELDDTYRPSIDNTVIKQKEDTTSREYISYDDLRRKNREAYEKSLTSAGPGPRQPGRRPPPRPAVPPASDMYSAPISSSGLLDEPVSTPSPPSGQRRNQYGDVIE